MDSTQKSPERAFALQNYLLFHSQKHALSRHLNNIATSTLATTSPPPQSSNCSRRTPLSPASRSSRSEDISLTSSQCLTSQRQQLRGGSISNAQQLRPTIIARRSSLPSAFTESMLREIEEDENKLKNVNEQIKCTLSHLLKCDGVKDDIRYRVWVETRLMDVEKELLGYQSQRH